MNINRARRRVKWHKQATCQGETVVGNLRGHIRYRMGIDVGVASLGIAILELKDGVDPETGEPEYVIVGGHVRTYPIPLGAEERRIKRGMRRNTGRLARRLDRLSDLLTEAGIGHRRKALPKEMLDLSPVKLRAMASREKVELAHLSRALLHMARHRGSSAFREANIEVEDKEKRLTAQGISSLRKEMKARGHETYGQYLRWREKKNLPTRINAEKMADNKEGYAFYPSREMLRDEFEIIWDQQARHYPDKLTGELKDTVADELFFQRAITSPPPGRCPYFPEQLRLPRASRLFQIRRIYEEANHLRFSTRTGEAIAYGLAERDKIVARLKAGEDLSFAEIKTTIGLKRTDKASLEESQARKGIEGYPFDRALGAPEALGKAWLNAGEDLQDEILNIFATEHDEDIATAKLSELLAEGETAASRALTAPLPSGWGRMGQRATEAILAELKVDVVPARIAEDRAGLFHAMTQDGVVHDRLPYYGKILVGHAVDPIWVSRYRRDTDLPPRTNPDEQRFGRIPNPVVHLALNQIRRMVNAAIREYGLPESIHIELSRDLNKSAEARDEISREIKKNRDETDRAAEDLVEIGVPVNRLNLQKYKLWQEQGCVCAYTLKCLNLESLYNGDAQVDHILPRSKTYSDALSNKVVCLRHANAEKGNRPPFEAFRNNPDYDWEAIKRLVEKLPKNKQWRFDADAMKQFEGDEESYRKRYGVDNSYIARLTRQYLVCLYGEQHKVVAVSSHIVALLRAKWGLQNILGSRKSGRKSRDDHRHHFVDALVTACATRGMVQRIQSEAARCEREDLEVFIETVDPPFGGPKQFFNAAREAVQERVILSRKADHGTGGQLHEDTLLGIVGERGDDGSYVCRIRKKLLDYSTLEALEKPRIKSTLPDDISEIAEARQALEALRDSVRGRTDAAAHQLEEERQADIVSGKKGRKVSDRAIYSCAVRLHEDAGGKSDFTLYQKNKLVNVRRAGNRPTGGYISGRNHRMDFYLDDKGKLCWQVISMMEANDTDFLPLAKRPDNRPLWSAHKEDVLEMDDPEDSSRRIRVVVSKLAGNRMGVVPEADARDSKQRVMWEKRLSFFSKAGAQRIVTNALGNIEYRFPPLPCE